MKEEEWCRNKIPEELFYLYNSLGYSDLEVSTTFRNSDGEICFGKWRKFSDLMQSDWVEWTAITERRILDIEIVLDYDEFVCTNCFKLTSRRKCCWCDKDHTESEQKEGIKAIAKFKADQLKQEGYFFKMYQTGSKGFHIHLLFPELRDMSKLSRERFKEQFIIMHQAERGKKIERVMIMRENSLHRKTNNPKSIISSREGFNYIPKCKEIKSIINANLDKKFRETYNRE